MHGTNDRFEPGFGARISWLRHGGVDEYRVHGTVSRGKEIDKGGEFVGNDCGGLGVFLPHVPVDEDAVFFVLASRAANIREKFVQPFSCSVRPGTKIGIVDRRFGTIGSNGKGIPKDGNVDRCACSLTNCEFF